jgi:hypothetical protein
MSNKDKFFYGIKNESHALQIISEVCEHLNKSNCGGSELLLLETAATETHLGKLKGGAGHGWMQIDPICLKDVQLHIKSSDRATLMNRWGINIDTVKITQLDNNPLLCAIIARLAYKRVPEPIPMKFKERAEYWKKHYNTEAGKGTVEHYIECATAHIYDCPECFMG